MAEQHLKSGPVTNYTASPKVANNPNVQGAFLRTAVGRVASAADDTSASTYRFFRIPSNARPVDILLTCADASSAGAIHVGLKHTDENGGAVVDENFFADAFALTNGPYLKQSLIHEGSSAYTQPNCEKPIWEVLGLTADPGIEYEVYATVSTTLNGGPTDIKLEGVWAV